MTVQSYNCINHRRKFKKIPVQSEGFYVNIGLEDLQIPELPEPVEQEDDIEEND
jgi:hypothetical protein